MPLAEALRKPIDANWTFRKINYNNRIIHFIDCSEGEITSWHWDLWDGATSEEQNPVRRYVKEGDWTVILPVEGPGGKSIHSRVLGCDCQMKEYKN